MEFTETVLVLQVGRFREADVWVRFLSPTKGVQTGFAFGGSRSRRRFSGCLDACNQVRFHVKATRRSEYLNLMEGTLVKSPQRLRSDWQRLGLAANCMKFLEAAMAGPQGPELAKFVFKLARETLDILDAADEVSALFPVFFRASLTFGLGYAPCLAHCATCGAPTLPDVGTGCKTGQVAQGISFFVEEGKAVCHRCPSPATGLRLPLSPAALRTLEYVRARGPADWIVLRPGPVERRECAALIDHFVRYHVGLAWEHGRFRRV